MLSLRHRYLITACVSIAIIITVFVILYFSNGIYTKLLRHPSGVIALEIADSIVNQFDVFRIFQRSPLPANSYVNLELSGSDVQYITRQIDRFIQYGHIPDRFKSWRKGAMHLDGKSVEISYRFHGTSVTPLRRGGFSLRIRHEEDVDYRELMRSYNLITSKDDADISTIWINQLAENIGLISPHGKMVIFRINGVDLGLYMMVEELEAERLERNHGITNYTIIKAIDDWDKKSNNHRSALDLWVGNQEVSGTAINSDVALGAFNLLTEAILGNDLSTIRRLLNLEYMAKFMALGALINNSHPITGDNLRYIYDFSTGEFSILFRIEDTILPLTSTVEDFNSSWFNTPIDYRDSETHELFRLLLQDAEFRHLRDQELHNILQAGDAISKDARSVYARNHPVILHSSEPRRRYNHDRDVAFATLNRNLETIENYLNYTKIFVNQVVKNGQLTASILNDSFHKVSLEGAILEKQPHETTVFQREIPSHSLNAELRLDHKVTEIDLPESSPISDLIVRNLITSKLVDSKDIYINTATAVQFLDETASLETLQRNGIEFIREDNKVTIQRGTYHLDSDVITPKGASVEIQAGTALLLSPDVSVLIQGTLLASGTTTEPILIKKNEDEPFGTFAVLGQTHNDQVVLEHLSLSGGSDSVIQGVTFSGQLSVHHADATLRNVTISDSRGDDGLNIRGANVTISESVFRNNQVDQVDLDFCLGLVERSFFESQSHDQDGDGLDLSGTTVVLRNNVFRRNPDKGVSVGERSVTLIVENHFQSNNNAIAVKDGSAAFSLDNIFDKNLTSYEVFVKKPFFSQPSLFLEQQEIITDLEVSEGAVTYLDREEILARFDALQ